MNDGTNPDNQPLELEVVSTALTSPQPPAGAEELELAAAQELGAAIEHLERRDRPAARQCINQAIENLNEAEIE